MSTLYNGLLNDESICYDEVDDLLISNKADILFLGVREMQKLTTEQLLA